MIKSIIILSCLSIVLSACSKSNSISVPVKYCKSQATNTTRVVQDVINTCYQYKDGMCTFSVPTYYDRTERVYVVTCEYQEWRSE